MSTLGYQGLGWGAFVLARTWVEILLTSPVIPTPKQCLNTFRIPRNYCKLFLVGLYCMRAGRFFWVCCRSIQGFPRFQWIRILTALRRTVLKIIQQSCAARECGRMG